MSLRCVCVCVNCYRNKRLNSIWTLPFECSQGYWMPHWARMTACKLIGINRAEQTLQLSGTSHLVGFATIDTFLQHLTFLIIYPNIHLVKMSDLSRSEKYKRRLMVLLRCFMATSYLWMMLQAAAIAPGLKNQSKTRFLFRKKHYVVIYKTLLPFAKTTQLYVTLIILAVMLRLYKCCRSKVWFCSPDPLIIGHMKRIRFNMRHIIHFGAYLLLFLAMWIASVYTIYNRGLRVCLKETFEDPLSVYAQLAFTIIFKLLALANVIDRSLRVYLVLKLFNTEAECMINPHDFGEHLNLLLQN